MQNGNDIQIGVPGISTPSPAPATTRYVRRKSARKSVLLIANYRPDRQHSMLRYASWLSGAMVAEGFNVRRIEPTPHLGLFFPNHHGLRKWLAYVDKFIIFPIKLLAIVRRYDVVHICDHGNAPYQQFMRGVPTVVTCHDLLAVKSALGETESANVGVTGKIFQSWILSSLKKIKYVSCDSAETESDFLRLVGKHSRQVKVIPMVLNYPFSRMPENLVQRTFERIGFANTEPYFMHIGGNNWYKNRAGVVELFAELRKKEKFKNFSLVMIGSAIPEEIEERIRALGISAKIIRILGASSEAVRAFYSSAQALLFPSLQEGFGWPILEAQACGCAVVTSNREPMPSVGGDAAYYIDPISPVESADLIAQNWQWIQSREDAAIENLSRYSQVGARAQLCALYQAAMSDSSDREES